MKNKALFRASLVAGAVAFGLGACSGSGSEEPGASSSDQARTVSPAPWGEVEAIVGEGSFEVCRGDCRKVTSGMALSLGDTISTDQSARASLILGDGSRLRLDADTRLTLEDRGLLRLEAGEIVLETKDQITIQTPSSKITARPGAMSISARPDRSRLGVMAGDADLEVNGERRTLAAGEAATVEGDKEIRILPSADLAYQTAWARDMEVEAEQSDEGAAPEGIGNIRGKDPATRKELPEAIVIPQLKVNVAVRERVARTEIEQIFKNTTARTLEGIYTFPLPHDASIVRFAMEINGQMMEGEIVEKGRAVKIFNSIVADHVRPKDPALLEWKGGNTFQIRIFPIFPKTQQRVVLWYTQALSAGVAGSRYTYPLPRTGKIGIDRFEFSADIESDHPLETVRTPMYASSVEMLAQGRRAEVQFQKESFHPRQDLVLEWAAPQSTNTSVFMASDRSAGHDPYFMMVLRPSLQGHEQPSGVKAGAFGTRDHLFAVDTSFGTNEGDLKAEVAAVASWLARLGPDDRFAVMAADQTQRVWKQGLVPVTSDNVQQALAFLESQKSAGASDVEGVFRKGAEVLKGSQSPVMIYVGDGQATLGETRHEPLIDSIDGLFARAKSPTIHAVGVGSEVNVAMLGAVTRRFGGSVLVLNRGEDVPRRVADMALGARRPSLRQATITFSSDKIDMVYPTHLPTLHAGEEVVVVGRYKGVVDGQVTLTGLVGDEPFAQPFRVKLDDAQAQTRSFVPRLWAQQHIEHLTLYGGARSRDEIISTSRQHTVMSRFTTFLVLESERMYARYKVDRDVDRQYWDSNKNKDDKKAEQAPKEPASEDLYDKGTLGRNAERGDDFDGDRKATEEDDAADGNDVVQLDSPLDRAQARGAGDSGRRGREGAQAERERDKSISSAWGGDEDNEVNEDPAPVVESKVTLRKKSEKLKGASARPMNKAKDRAGPSKPKTDSMDDLLDGLGGKRSSNRRRPAAKAPPKKASKGGGKMAFGDGGSDYYRQPRPVPTVKIRSLPPEPNARQNATLVRLQSLVTANPLRRDHRRKLVNHLMRRGDAQAARAALEDWLSKDPRHALVHWRLADMLARTGDEASAEKHFGNAIEAAPTDPGPLKRWALHLMLRGDHRLAASAYRALAALTGRIEDALDLVAVEALVSPDTARDHLARLRASLASKMTKAHQTRADALAAVLSSGRGDPLAGMPGAERNYRGSAVITMGWEGDTDLDLSVLLPYGERISPDMPMSTRAEGKRGYVAAHAATGHPVGSRSKTPLEALVLPWFPMNGTHTVEVVRRGDTAAPVKAWVRVKARGATRTFQIEIPAGDRDARVATFKLSY